MNHIYERAGPHVIRKYRSHRHSRNSWHHCRTSCHFATYQLTRNIPLPAAQCAGSISVSTEGLRTKTHARLQPRVSHACCTRPSRRRNWRTRNNRWLGRYCCPRRAAKRPCRSRGQSLRKHGRFRGRASVWHRFVNRLRTQGEAALCDELDRLIEIEIDGSDKYLDDMTAALETADTPTKRRLYALIAKQYENRGDTARAREARDAARAC